MILLAGGDIVLTNRVIAAGSLLIDGARIAAVEPRVIDTPSGATRIDTTGSVVVPGFVDVHVHGVEGHDVLDGPGAVTEVARRLPQYGVTSFCPTSIACGPRELARFLREVEVLRGAPVGRSARVLPAHLESNFINPDFRGAQPVACLRTAAATNEDVESMEYGAADILDTIAARRESVGIVTLAPELPGGLELVRLLSGHGHRVSVGHSGATYEETMDAISAGVCHATHLFNRMTPLLHRAPGVAGAVLQSERVTPEIICDGFHVHPALMRIAIRAKGTGGILAITDGTAGSGLPVGSRTRLGGRRITVTDRAAELDDGTLAGSVLTMDGAFRALIAQTGVSIIEAALMCATNPAREIRLTDSGRIEVGAVADLAVLDRSFQVRRTFLAGEEWRNTLTPPLV